MSMYLWNPCIYGITEVGTFNNGRLGLCAAVWLHRLKSVSTSFGCCSDGAVCDDSTVEGDVCTNASLYKCTFATNSGEIKFI